MLAIILAVLLIVCAAYGLTHFATDIFAPAVCRLEQPTRRAIGRAIVALSNGIYDAGRRSAYGLLTLACKVNPAALDYDLDACPECEGQPELRPDGQCDCLDHIAAGGRPYGIGADGRLNYLDTMPPVDQAPARTAVERILRAAVERVMRSGSDSLYRCGDALYRAAWATLQAGTAIGQRPVQELAPCTCNAPYGYDADGLLTCDGCEPEPTAEGLYLSRYIGCDECSQPATREIVDQAIGAAVGFACDEHNARVLANLNGANGLTVDQGEATAAMMTRHCCPQCNFAGNALEFDCQLLPVVEPTEQPPCRCAECAPTTAIDRAATYTYP